MEGGAYTATYDRSAHDGSAVCRGDAPAARRLALRVAAALAAGALGLDPGRFVPVVRVRIPGGAPAALPPRIAQAVFDQVVGEKG